MLVKKTVGSSAGDFYEGGERKTLTSWIQTALKSPNIPPVNGENHLRPPETSTVRIGLMSHNHFTSQKKPNYLCSHCQVWLWINWWWCKRPRTQLWFFWMYKVYPAHKWLVTSGFCHWGLTTNWYTFKASKSSLEECVALWTWLRWRRSNRFE